MKKSTAKPSPKCLNRIGEVMSQKAITQEELAERTGVTQRSISLYVNGLREPSLETLSKVATALKVPGKDIINF